MNYANVLNLICNPQKAKMTETLHFQLMKLIKIKCNKSKNLIKF